jgi:hypothetical protein
MSILFHARPFLYLPSQVLPQHLLALHRFPPALWTSRTARRTRRSDANDHLRAAAEHTRESLMACISAAARGRSPCRR